DHADIANEPTVQRCGQLVAVVGEPAGLTHRAYIAAGREQVGGVSRAKADRPSDRAESSGGLAGARLQLDRLEQLRLDRNAADMVEQRAMLRRAVDRHVELAVFQPAHVDFLGDPPTVTDGVCRKMSARSLACRNSMSSCPTTTSVSRPTTTMTWLPASTAALSLSPFSSEIGALCACAAGAIRRPAASAASETLYILRVIPPPPANGGGCKTSCE